LSAGERDAKAPAAGIPLHVAAQVFRVALLDRRLN